MRMEGNVVVDPIWTGEFDDGRTSREEGEGDFGGWIGGDGGPGGEAG